MYIAEYENITGLSINVLQSDGGYVFMAALGCYKCQPLIYQKAVIHFVRHMLPHYDFSATASLLMLSWLLASELKNEVTCQ